MRLLPVEVNGQGTLLVAQLLLPAAFPAACPRRFQPGMRPLADQVPLEFRQRREDVTQHAPAGEVASLTHRIAVVMQEDATGIGPPLPLRIDLLFFIFNTIKNFIN